MADRVATAAEKNAAHKACRTALKRGELIKPEHCSQCSRKTGTIVGHHNDYSKPLDVVWLCRWCHHVHHYGPSPADAYAAMQDALNAGKTIRQAAEKLGLDPKTLALKAAKAPKTRRATCYANVSSAGKPDHSEKPA